MDRGWWRGGGSGEEKEDITACLIKEDITSRLLLQEDITSGLLLQKDIPSWLMLQEDIPSCLTGEATASRSMTEDVSSSLVIQNEKEDSHKTVLMSGVGSDNVTL